MDSHAKYHHEIDLLRGLAIISLIITHICSYCFAIKGINAIVLINIPVVIFSRFAVPVFVFISGFVLYLKYARDLNYKDFYKKRFLKIIPPYIIFSILYYFYNGFVIKNMSFNIKDLVYQIITAKAHIHLWYLLLIIQLYLLFPFILKIYLKIKRKNLFVLVIFIIQITWRIIHPEIKEKLECSVCNVFQLFLRDVIFDRRFFLSQIAYLIFGFYLSTNINFIKKHILNITAVMIIIIAIAINSLIYVRGINIYDSIPNIPTSFMIPVRIINIFLFTATIVILYQIANRFINYSVKIQLIKTIKEYGLHSYGIYLIHAGIISILSVFLLKAGLEYSNILFYVLLLIATIPLSYYISMYISKLPYSEYVIGKRSKHKKANERL
jgi:peptidoglycan/LPS O-acetylase OafA/YrhL